MAKQQASHGFPQQLEEIKHWGGLPQPWRKARDGLTPAIHPSALTYPTSDGFWGKGSCLFPRWGSLDSEREEAQDKLARWLSWEWNQAVGLPVSWGSMWREEHPRPAFLTWFLDMESRIQSERFNTESFLRKICSSCQGDVINGLTTPMLRHRF